MKRAFLYFVIYLTFSIQALGYSSVEMIKFIGMYSQQPEFADIYTSYFSEQEPDKYSELYGAAYSYYYDAAVFVFSYEQQLLQIIYKDNMPFGLKNGTCKTWVGIKLRLKGVNPKTLESKDGYVLEIEYDEANRVETMKVSAGWDLKKERTTGTYSIDGMVFEHAYWYTQYKSLEKGAWFFYLRGKDGICQTGDCNEGTGIMVWENKGVMERVEFKGSFEKNEPRHGELQFKPKEYEDGHLSEVTFNDQHLIEGKVKWLRQDGSIATLWYTDGNVDHVWDLHTEDYIYSGPMSIWLRETWSEITPSHYQYPDYDVEAKQHKDGYLEGGINYRNGITFDGYLTYDLKPTGLGRLIDTVYGSYLWARFNRGVPNNTKWEDDSMVYRSGDYDPFKGLHGIVETTYETYYSVYTVKGRFENHKPIGTHIMIEEATGKQVARGEYRNGQWINGHEFYDKKGNTVMSLFQENRRLLDELKASATTMIADFGSSVESVESNTLRYSGGEHVTWKYLDVNKNDAVRFMIYDPFSNSDTYTIEIWAGDFNYPHKYPKMTLYRDKTNPSFYSSNQGVSTNQFYRLHLTIRSQGASKNKYAAQLFTIYDW